MSLRVTGKTGGKTESPQRYSCFVFEGCLLCDCGPVCSPSLDLSFLLESQEVDQMILRVSISGFCKFVTLRTSDLSGGTGAANCSVCLQRRFVVPQRTQGWAEHLVHLPAQEGLPLDLVSLSGLKLWPQLLRPSLSQSLCLLRFVRVVCGQLWV